MFENRQNLADLRGFSGAYPSLKISPEWLEARAGIEPACTDLQSAT